MTLRVASLHRYPVKSMLGESVEAAQVGSAGIDGDRAYALLDHDTGLVVSAKQPRKWGRLLRCQAVIDGDGVTTITLPGGRGLTAGEPAADDALSEYCERRVTVSREAPTEPHLERLWPEVEGLAPLEVTDRIVTPMAAAAPQTFFDYAPIHIVTTASLQALKRSHPAGDFSLHRFRPNIVLDSDEQGFVENAWPGRRLSIGDVVLEVLTVTPRCAVPSLAHGELPADLGVLGGVVAENRIAVGDGRFACVGVYAKVLASGTISVGRSASIG